MLKKKEPFGTIKWEHIHNIFFVTMIGELSESAFIELVNECEKIKNTTDKILFNMEKLIYLNSAGIGSLVTINRMFEKRAFICGIPGFLSRLFRLMKLDPLFQMFDDKYQAIDALIEIHSISDDEVFKEVGFSNISIVFICENFMHTNCRKLINYIMRLSQPYIIIDMRLTRRIDSSGLGALVETFKKFGKKSCLCNVLPTVEGVMKVLKLEIKREQYLPDALLYLEDIQKGMETKARSVTPEFIESHCILHVEGVLDAQTTRELIAPLNIESETLILEVEKVEKVSQDTMIQILLLYKKYLNHFAVYHPSEKVMESIKELGFDTFMTVLHSYEEVVEFIKKHKAAKEQGEAKEGVFTIIRKEKGYYLTVYPPSENRGVVKKERVFEELRKKKIRIDDATTVGRIVETREGIPYKISKYDLNISQIVVEVSPNLMEAYVTLNPPLVSEGEIYPDLEDVLYMLKKNNIKYGIHMEALRELVHGKIIGKRTHAASGKYPVHGTDEQVKFLVKVEMDRKPAQLFDGRVDFHHVNVIPSISKDQPILERTLAGKGEDGYKVNGERIHAHPGNSSGYNFGRNTYFSADGRKLHSTVNGHLFYDEKHRIIDVYTVLTIENDVDYSTGNIDFAGDVHIKGSVKAGFQVLSGGRVLIDGSVEAGSVCSKGNLIINSGIYGHNKTVIETEGDLICKSIQEAEVMSGGNIIASGEVRHCQIIACGTFSLATPKSSVLGGKICAGVCITVPSAGSSVQVNTVLTVDNIARVIVEKRKEKLESEIAEDRKHMGEIIEIIKNSNLAEKQYAATPNKEGFVDELCHFNKHQQEMKDKEDLLLFYKLLLIFDENKIETAREELRNRLVEILREISEIKEPALKYISNINRNIYTLSKNDIDTIERYYTLEKMQQNYEDRLTLLESVQKGLKGPFEDNFIDVTDTCYSGVVIKIFGAVKEIFEKRSAVKFIVDKGKIKIVSD